MMETVVIALERFKDPASEIAAKIGGRWMPYSATAFEECFESASRIVALMSMGICIRSIAPLLKDKWTDPAVVVVSPDLRFAIPIIGGHHGANELAHDLASFGLIPVISTATEATGRPSVEGIARIEACEVVNRDSTRRVNAAILDGDVPVYPVNGPAIVLAGPGVSFLTRKGVYIVGIGCRAGVSPDEVTDAVRQALNEVSADMAEVLVYATTVKKQGEKGLIEAVGTVGGNLVFLDDETLNSQKGVSPSRAGMIGLQAVAEPAALALAKNHELILQKTVYGRVTIAIAR